jgi:hypothetical protein
VHDKKVAPCNYTALKTRKNSIWRSTR